MRLLLAILLLLFSGVAYAAGVLHDPSGSGDMIVFSESPCTTAAVLANIKPEYHSAFKQAGVKFQGRLISACWAISPNDPDVVIILDAEGDGGPIPRQAIKFDPKV